MAPTLQPLPLKRFTPARFRATRPDPEPASDDELRALKRELAAAKDRFLRLAQDAENARLAAVDAESQARARLNTAVEILSRARTEPDGPSLAAAVDNALNALRS
jgi:hypothetical protein